MLQRVTLNVPSPGREPDLPLLPAVSLRQGIHRGRARRQGRGAAICSLPAERRDRGRVAPPEGAAVAARNRRAPRGGGRKTLPGPMERLRRLWRGRTMTYGVPLLVSGAGGGPRGRGVRGGRRALGAPGAASRSFPCMGCLKGKWLSRRMKSRVKGDFNIFYSAFG